MFTGDYVKTLM